MCLCSLLGSDGGVSTNVEKVVLMIECRCSIVSDDELHYLLAGTGVPYSDSSYASRLAVCDGGDH